jgi:benzylsuccinate CoA-transferase BbsF subunit
MSRRGPLKGYRILDFGWVAAGPLLSCLLSDMGAEVIKVESRKRLDSSRFTPDNTERDPDRDPWFHSMNRGKLGITVDFSCVKGAQIVRSLVRESDVIVENFSPGVLRKYKLDYSELRKTKSDIIMISLSAAGQSGPLSNIVTYGPSLNGLAGVDSLVGYYEERVLGMQQAFADINAALHGAFSVLAALWHREETGEGQYIDLAQVEALVSVTAEAVLEYTMNQRTLGTLGNHSRIMAPHNNYPCQGKDNWVSIAIGNEEEWEKFCKAIGSPIWCSDDKFDDALNRIKHQQELDKLISDWTRQHTDYEVMEILQFSGVASVPCMDIEDRYCDPHFMDREVYISTSDPQLGTFFMPNIPWKMDFSSLRVERPAPKVGEHNYYVLRDILGMEKDQIDKMVEEKVIY